MMEKTYAGPTAHKARTVDTVAQQEPAESRHVMSTLIEQYDWSSTPLGPRSIWPQHLKSACDIMLNSAFPMFIWWHPQDMVNIYNDAFIPILGDRHPQALGKAAKSIWHDIWDDISPFVEQVFREGRPIYRDDLKLALQRGSSSAPLSEAYFTFSYSPIKSPAGSVEGLFCAITETTEEVLARRKLSTLNDAKDEFISLASHQLRTPATGVKQYLGMLLGDFAGPLTPAQREFAQHAYDSNERQLSTVSDLLSVAQADAGRIDLHRRPTDVVSLIYAILDEQSTKFAERSQVVSFTHDRPICNASIDEERMRMVLDNLVDNASKYTEDGKKIKVSLTTDLPKPGKAGTPAPTCINIRIKDQGVGIDQAGLAVIFDKFIRVDNALSEKVGGSGLGLYLAQKIVQLHDGKLTVISTPGKGSTFRIKIPVS